MIISDFLIKFDSTKIQNIFFYTTAVRSTTLFASTHNIICCELTKQYKLLLSISNKRNAKHHKMSKDHQKVERMSIRVSFI